jgi:hypothetical protein
LISEYESLRSFNEKKINCIWCENLIIPDQLAFVGGELRHLKEGQFCHIGCYFELTEDKAVERVLKILELRNA